MKHRIEPDGTVVVSLERGDAVHDAVERAAKTLGIKGAQVSAIGAIEDPVLAYYDLDRKEYLLKEFPGRWELAPLEGNLTMKEGAPFLHAHVTIGGRDCAAYAGHLMRAKVAVAVELFMRPVGELKRLPCDDIGLHRWEPGA